MIIKFAPFFVAERLKANTGKTFCQVSGIALDAASKVILGDLMQYVQGQIQEMIQNKVI